MVIRLKSIVPSAECHVLRTDISIFPFGKHGETQDPAVLDTYTDSILLWVKDYIKVIVVLATMAKDANIVVVAAPLSSPLQWHDALKGKVCTFIKNRTVDQIYRFKTHLT